jgi:hypothetical protein
MVVTVAMTSNVSKFQVVTCRVLVGFWEKARGHGSGLATGLKFWVKEVILPLFSNSLFDKKLLLVLFSFPFFLYLLSGFLYVNVNLFMKGNHHQLHGNWILENCPDESGLEINIDVDHQSLFTWFVKRESWVKSWILSKHGKSELMV